MQPYLQMFGPFLGLFLVFMLFVLLSLFGIAPSAFYSFYNVKTIITQTVITGIGALGMTMVIISGGIDLSVGSVIALSTVVTAQVLNLGGSEGNAGLWLPFAAVGCAALVGGACGLFNGAVSAALRMVPFIVTLGMMQIARGLAKWVGKEQTVLSPDNWLNGFMVVDPTPGWLLFAPGVWLLIGLTVFLSIMLTRTVFGRYIFALGSNENTARLCGINVTGTRTLIYTLSGIFTGIAGIMQFANLTVGDPTAAQGMELDIIAAVIIGGGSLSGGEGTARGSLIGALMMAVLRNGCNLVGIPNYVQNILIGAIIIGAVAVDRYKQRIPARQ
ncbi:MAG: ABC transporter permease [Chitinivibrionales bacterium]|nr:ABC transporter permease [Chitinivibrionales bacterium]